MTGKNQLRRSGTRLQKQGTLLFQQTRGAGETFLAESREAGRSFMRDMGAASNKLAGSTGKSADAFRKDLYKEVLDWQRFLRRQRG